MSTWRALQKKDTGENVVERQNIPGEWAGSQRDAYLEV